MDSESAACPRQGASFGMSCFTLGDSIALGLALISPCEHSAKVGISSAAVARYNVPQRDVTVISAGSNDPANPKLRNNLIAIRKKAHNIVVWIVPQNGRAAYVVRSVAGSYGDRTATFKPSRDGVHPRSYRELKKAVF